MMARSPTLSRSRHTRHLLLVLPLAWGACAGSPRKSDAPSPPTVAQAPPASPAPAASPAAKPAPVPSEGCAAGSGLPEGAATIDVEGVARPYVLRLPAGYTRERPWPLVLALHPNGKAPNPKYWDAEGGVRPLRATVHDRAIVLIAMPRTGDWRAEPQVDLQYFDALLARLKAALCIDTGRIFSMGFSGGGSYSGMLACYRRDIRAIAVGGSVTYFKPDECVGHAAAWITIGQGELVPARERFRDYWRARGGCQATSRAVEPEACTAYDACSPATPVRYCPHPKGHEWPPFGTQAAWDFFAQF